MLCGYSCDRRRHPNLNNFKFNGIFPLEKVQKGWMLNDIWLQASAELVLADMSSINSFGSLFGDP